MPDKYLNFEVLSRYEKNGVDFIISKDIRKVTSTLLLSPHAGRIEPGISEIILSAARDDLSYYLFEGIKPQRNRELHITSPNFDEPDCLTLIRNSEKVVAIHGEHSEDEVIYVGGLDKQLREHLKNSFITYSFRAREHAKPGLQGISPKNICNRGKSGAGVQLELSKGLRRSFFQSLKTDGQKKPTAQFYAFIEALRNGLRHAGAL